MRPPVVEAFGLSIASDYPFRLHHARGRGRPDVLFEVVDGCAVVGFLGAADFFV